MAIVSSLRACLLITTYAHKHLIALMNQSLHSSTVTSEVVDREIYSYLIFAAISSSRIKADSTSKTYLGLKYNC